MDLTGTDHMATDSRADAEASLAEQAALEEEAALVERARRDPTAFGQLYELHYSAILNYFARRTLDASLSEELTSEVFFKGLRGIRRFRNQVPFRAWLYRIAGNELKMHWRRLRSQRRKEESIQSEAMVGRLYCTQPAQSAQETLQERLKQHAVLVEALARLPARYREAIVLRYFDGLKYEEIGLVLSKSSGTVKSLVHRGLKKMKGQFEGISTEIEYAPRYGERERAESHEEP